MPRVDNTTTTTTTNNNTLNDPNHGDSIQPQQQQPPLLEPTATPKYVIAEDMASSMKFYTLCAALEAVWNASVNTASTATNRSSSKNSNNNNNNNNSKRWSETQKLWKILPPKFLHHLQEATSTTTATTKTVQSIFPILRLLLPEKDGSRQFQMAESTISIMYGNALGLSATQKSSKYQMLLNYTDPNYVTQPQDGLGDLSLVVQTVVATTKIHVPSTFTIGQINMALDVLATIPARAKQMKSNHDWKASSSSTSEATAKQNHSAKKLGKKKVVSMKDLRIQWLRQLNDGTFRGGSSTSTGNNGANGANDANPNPGGTNHGLSPLEHKWLVRILLRKMQFGLVRFVLLFCFCLLSCLFVSVGGSMTK